LLDEAAPAAEVQLGGVERERVLRLFGAARMRQIRDAYRAGEEWDAEWLSDVNAAYAILSESPRVDEWTLLEHHDFLAWIGATSRANEVLEGALERFPDSAVLHERLRGRLLWEGGPDELERAYGERLGVRDDAVEGASRLGWFAGYASLVAAEHYRRRGRFEDALAAYRRGIERYERYVEQFPESRDDGEHYVALAHAGRARVALERAELDAAESALLRALELRPESAASSDGLGISAVATAKMLRIRLLQSGDAEGAARVQAALDALDPKLLEPPPSELPARRWRRPGGSGR